MADEDIHDIEPEDSEESTPVTRLKGRKSFINVRRELSEDELSTPAVQRLLLDELDRIEIENGIFNKYQTLYYEADKEAGILKEKLKTNTGTDIIFGVCVTIGAVLMGFAPSLWSVNNLNGWISVGLGLILVACGIASKVVKR